MKQCAVGGYRRGVNGHDLCGTHHSRWKRVSGPDLAAWVASQPPPGEDRPECAVEECEVAVEVGRGKPPLCRSHQTRWRHHGCPSVDDFVKSCARYGWLQFDLRSLDPMLQLEFQYALQRRVDERQVKAQSISLTPALRVLRRLQVPSLLAEPLEQRVLPALGPTQTSAACFLRFAVERLRDLDEGVGWEQEYPRDVWRLDRLLTRQSKTVAHLRFTGFVQPWFTEAAKRWARWRLSTGLSVNSIYRGLEALRSVSASLQHGRQTRAPLSELDRPAIERWLAALHRVSASQRSGTIGALSTFLRDARQHGWLPGLPPTAQVFRSDYPRRTALAPRYLSEFVMAQLESPAAQQHFPDPAFGLLTRIIMATGLRLGDALRLPVDCLVRDASGARYLRYLNHKMAREAFVPIADDLAEDIEAQQRKVRACWPRPVLFPRAKANPDGTRPGTGSGYYGRLKLWLQRAAVHDELGAVVHVTPHQFRHTFATRLVNRDVPLEVVRKLLDHTSHTMTAHYARIADRTVREHWERAHKVNARGEPVTIDPTGPLADLTWMKQSLSRATQALPNGYCGLPIQRSCPHANACLDCPVFVTTGDFLPQHREQLAATRRLIATAEADGRFRMVEMNQRVADNLERVITALETDRDDARAR